MFWEKSKSEVNMPLKFYKMAAAGNDFILLDNRKQIFTGCEKSFFQKLCQRRLSIGADGIILLEESQSADFAYRHFNADGGEAEMCGNGARCICYFAVKKRIAHAAHRFEINQRLFTANCRKNSIKILFPPPENITTDLNLVQEEDLQEGGFVNTGVPHLVIFTQQLEQTAVLELGRRYRHHPFFENGVNVNFVKISSKTKIHIRTYERGVEEETLACGTGALAAAIIAYHKKYVNPPVTIVTAGGALHADWQAYYKRLSLSGTAEIIYTGSLPAGL